MGAQGGRGLGTLDQGIEALNKQTDAMAKQIDTNARLETEREKTDRMRIRLAELQEKNQAARQGQLVRLVAGILILAGLVIAGLLWKGETRPAVTVLTTTVVGVLSLFAGKSVLGRS